MLDKYNPAGNRIKHYQNWEEQGYFQPDMGFDQNRLSPSNCPPPNVTGTLQ